MQETRHQASTCFTSVNNDNSKTIWYDDPPPVIIHCCQDSNVKLEKIANQSNIAAAIAEEAYERNLESVIDSQKVCRQSEEQEAGNEENLNGNNKKLLYKDGITRIRFNFLQGNENVSKSVFDDETSMSMSMSMSTSTSMSTTSQQQLYDFPKNKLYVTDESKTEKVIESSTRDETDNNTEFVYQLEKPIVDLPARDASYRKSEIADTRRSVRYNFHKRRIGKAWDKMRSWLRDETTKLNEVVNKHARLQAVGALTDQTESFKLSYGKTGSYDLTNHQFEFIDELNATQEYLPRSRRIESTTNNFTSSENIFTTETQNVEKEPSCDQDEQARKTLLIKRRMLGSIRGLMASTHLLQTNETEEAGQGGFEDVRRYVKQGGDFCKELAAILQERAELEANYAKGLNKLSCKLIKACAKDHQAGNSSGGVNEAWRCVGEEMEAAAEAHRVWGTALTEQLAKPLRVGVAEAQGRSRKSVENSVDKAGKSLHEWRNVATKTKKQSFTCARENERLQDLARLQTISQSQQTNTSTSTSTSTSSSGTGSSNANNNNNNNNNNNKLNNLYHHHHHHHHHMTEKEASKLEARRRKAEDSSRRADTEFYTVSVRAERARLEYECTVRKGAKQMQLLEEERLSALKDFANVYLAHLQALAPRLQQSADRLAAPVRNCVVSQDIETIKNLIRRIDENDVSNIEQLLPDFYAEHVTLAMNRDRRKQALIRVLHLIRQDLERERRGRDGLETLHRAFITTPAFAADESTQNVTDKLLHMRSMLLYLEAARYKVAGTLAQVEGSKRPNHPLAEHILVSRDKQGLQQSVLKIPFWAKNESFEIPDEIQVCQLAKDSETESRHWADRTAGDGNSENPPDEDDFSDFDEFSSHSEDNDNRDIETKSDANEQQCRAIYQYKANLNDELSLNPGDLITVHQKQSDGWWIGECRGQTGIFPATYVQLIH